jgi:hypothetical protein
MCVKSSQISIHKHSYKVSTQPPPLRRFITKKLSLSRSLDLSRFSTRRSGRHLGGAKAFNQQETSEETNVSFARRGGGGGKVDGFVCKDIIEEHWETVDKQRPSSTRCRIRDISLFLSLSLSLFLSLSLSLSLSKQRPTPQHAAEFVTHLVLRMLSSPHLRRAREERALACASTPPTAQERPLLGKLRS